MQKINPENRFEKMLTKSKRYFRKINYFIKAIIIFIILLILLEFFCYLVIVTHDAIHRQQAWSDDINFGVYKDKEWAINFYKDQMAVKTEHAPYLDHKTIPYVSNFVNINNKSIRKTFNPCLNNSKKVIKIFSFGGSTTWGAGSRDQGTIPSYLSSYLCNNSCNVEVTNFGELGYVSTQEIFKLQLQLRDGNIPDIVIFYDGSNDAFSSYQNRAAGLPENVEKRKKEYNPFSEYRIKELFKSTPRVFDKIFRVLAQKSNQNIFTDENLNNETAKAYLNNIKIVKSLGKAYDFESFFYWQPILFTKKSLSNYEIKKYNSAIEKTPGFDKQYEIISEIVTASEDVVDLTKIFNYNNETIFMDPVHMSEEGNSIIAKKIAEDIFKYTKKLESK